MTEYQRGTFEQRKRAKRSLTITVDKAGNMVCAFRVSGRKTAQASYRASGDHLDIYTGYGEAYQWLAGKI